MSEYEPTKAEVDKFLEELSELSRQHGIYIKGCGCCGSPYLKDHREHLLSERVGLDLKMDDDGQYCIDYYFPEREDGGFAGNI